MIITIDGPAGVGKGTIAKIISKSLGFKYLDSGAMYRALALFADLNGVSDNDSDRLKKILIDLHIQFIDDKEGERVLLNTDDVTEDIRTNEISTLASKFAANDIVRKILREMQRRMIKDKDFIAEGRDMGTYVFPDAEYKFYLDADLKIRAKRRANQLKEILGINMNEENVAKEISNRDNLDMTRESCPLHPAADAVIIDTSNMTIDEVVLKIKTVIDNA
ncbi:MAG: (d)CMP kinase [Thermodesulfobacteriota bacterium]|nr:MAG: (d)CMP kinase [Candidatus Dadabacteria bacterium]|tara:strand:+ start:33731 stop:34390 length:660 start_codon:yes stop_codon:yes gene_type:complete